MMFPRRGRKKEVISSVCVVLVNLAKYVVQGRVVEEDDRSVAGAALRDRLPAVSFVEITNPW